MSDFAISSRAGVLYWQGEERYIQGKEGGCLGIGTMETKGHDNKKKVQY